jgi:hypothetical protein
MAERDSSRSWIIDCFCGGAVVDSARPDILVEELRVPLCDILVKEARDAARSIAMLAMKEGSYHCNRIGGPATASTAPSHLPTPLLMFLNPAMSSGLRAEGWVSKQFISRDAGTVI